MKERGAIGSLEGQALQAKDIRPRSRSSDKSVKSLKEKDTGRQKQQQQTAKKNGPQVQSVKKNLPVEAENFGHLPPPAPMTAKKEAVPTKTGLRRTRSNKRHPQLPRKILHR
ncbi:hypothetical protein V7S43_016960 [Phytophthora oleae]|uniref:Uncharacterized protein n=1 Tax=Phytophthora oleae TaxID=2107226 RepID=A0ABD3EWN9_9STRA